VQGKQARQGGFGWGKADSGSGLLIEVLRELAEGGFTWVEPTFYVQF
jgi:hypothetical protein